MNTPAVTPGNLGADFRVDGAKYLNDTLVTGSGAPTSPPVEVNKTWLYVDTDAGQITHYWDGAAWEAIAASSALQEVGQDSLPAGTHDAIAYTLDAPGLTNTSLLQARDGAGYKILDTLPKVANYDAARALTASELEGLKTIQIFGVETELDGGQGFFSVLDSVPAGFADNSGTDLLTVGGQALRRIRQSELINIRWWTGNNTPYNTGATDAVTGEFIADDEKIKAGLAYCLANPELVPYFEGGAENNYWVTRGEIEFGHRRVIIHGRILFAPTLPATDPNAVPNDTACFVLNRPGAFDCVLQMGILEGQASYSQSVTGTNYNYVPIYEKAWEYGLTGLRVDNGHWKIIEPNISRLKTNIELNTLLGHVSVVRPTLGSSSLFATKATENHFDHQFDDGLVSGRWANWLIGGDSLDILSTGMHAGFAAHAVAWAIFPNARLAASEIPDFAVMALADSNTALSGEQTIDGVDVIAGQWVAVSGQTNSSENGIYQVETGAWVPCPDATINASDWTVTHPQTGEVTTIAAPRVYVRYGDSHEELIYEVTGGTSWARINGNGRVSYINQNLQRLRGVWATIRTEQIGEAVIDIPPSMGIENFVIDKGCNGTWSPETWDMNPSTWFSALPPVAVKNGLIQQHMIRCGPIGQRVDLDGNLNKPGVEFDVACNNYDGRRSSIGPYSINVLRQNLEYTFPRKGPIYPLTPSDIYVGASQPFGGNMLKDVEDLSSWQAPSNATLSIVDSNTAPGTFPSEMLAYMGGDSFNVVRVDPNPGQNLVRPTIDFDSNFVNLPIGENKVCIKVWFLAESTAIPYLQVDLANDSIVARSGAPNPGDWTELAAADCHSTTGTLLNRARFTIFTNNQPVYLAGAMWSLNGFKPYARRYEPVIETLLVPASDNPSQLMQLEVASTGVVSAVAV